MSKTDFEIYQNDLLPAMTIDVDDNGTPVDMTTATTVTVKAWQAGVVKFTRAASAVGIGTATLNWITGDTDTIGPMTVQVIGVWATKQLTIQAENRVQVLRREPSEGPG